MEVAPQRPPLPTPPALQRGENPVFNTKSQLASCSGRDLFVYGDSSHL